MSGNDCSHANVDFKTKQRMRDIKLYYSFFRAVSYDNCTLANPHLCYTYHHSFEHVHADGISVECTGRNISRRSGAFHVIALMIPSNACLLNYLAKVFNQSLSISLCGRAHPNAVAVEVVVPQNSVHASSKEPE